MKILISHVTGRRAFDDVEMIIVDDKEIVIWQPKAGNQRGSRRTRFERHEVMGIIYVDTDQKEKGKMETEKAKG